MIFTLKIILAILSVALIMTSLIAPSTNQSLEGVFTGQTDESSQSKPISKIVWIVLILWLIDAAAITLLLR